MSMGALQCTCESVIRTGICQLHGSLGKRQWDLLRQSCDAWRERAEAAAPTPPALDAELEAETKRILAEVAKGQENAEAFVGEDGEPYGPLTPREQAFFGALIEQGRRADKLAVSALDAEDRERLERVADELEDERTGGKRGGCLSVTHNELSCSRQPASERCANCKADERADLLRRLASHQPESQETRGDRYCTECVRLDGKPHGPNCLFAREERPEPQQEGRGELRDRLKKEVEYLDTIYLLADQESMHVGAEGNHLGECEAKGIATTAKNARDRLKAALDLQEEEGRMAERTEYRIVVRYGDGGVREGMPVRSRAVAEGRADFAQLLGECEVRIQQRTVFEAPWEDVEQGEEGR